MAKPDKYPRWADVGGSITEPSSGKKDVGWVVAEKPPAQYFNWLLNLIYLWIVWFDGMFGTESAPRTMSLGLSAGFVTDETTSWYRETFTGTDVGNWKNDTVNAWIGFTLPLNAGCSVKEVRVYGKASSSGTLKASLHHNAVNLGGPSITLTDYGDPEAGTGSVTSITGTTFVQEIKYVFDTPVSIGLFENLWLRLQSTGTMATAHHIYHVEVDYFDEGSP